MAGMPPHGAMGMGPGPGGPMGMMPPNAGYPPQGDVQGMGQAMGMGQGYSQGMGDMSGNMMGGPASMMSGSVFPAVKLRGLPFDVAEDDIRMFLGCDPVDILMVHRDGRLSGEAFAILPSPMQIELALSKNRTYLGRRYIEVFRAKKQDYYKAVVNEMMSGAMPAAGGGYAMGGGGGGGGYGMYGGGMQGGMPQAGGGYGGGGMQQEGGGMGGGSTILKMRGLPFSVQDEDIVRWFNEDPTLGLSMPLTSDSVFVVSEGGRPNGIAFVEFTTPQEASAAMAKNKQMMGSRYVELFTASKQDLARYQSRG